MIHLHLANTNNLEQITEMPEFFKEAVNWGITASYKAMGFIVLMTLAIKLFTK